MSRAPVLLPLLLVVCCNGPLAADTVYKSVDKDGNVTYSEKPPAGKDSGKTRTDELPIDPNQNVVPSEKTSNIRALEAEQKSRSEQDRASSAASAQSRSEKIAQAEAELQQAEAALAAGEHTQPGDFIGKAGSGVRPTQQRSERINALQQAVDAAKQNLERVQYDRNSY